MATVIAHAAMPWLAGRAARLPRKVVVVGAVLACAADLDLLGYAFDVHTLDVWGHRGALHAPLLGLAAGAALALLLFRRGAGFRAALVYLCLAGASHGLIDALTYGGPGVALLEPFSHARLLLPLHLVPVLPLGLPEVLSQLGVEVVADELLWLVLPWALLLSAARWVVNREARSRRSLMLLGAAAFAWACLFVSLRRQVPEVFGPPVERRVEANGGPGTVDDLQVVPRDGLPGGQLVTRLDELERLGLFGRRLEPTQRPWSGEFFPSWFGSEAGRWRDPHPLLLWRTLRGVTPPSSEELDALLKRASGGEASAKAQLFGLAPTEKYDLAVGDLHLSATRNSLLNGHNARPLPRFWDGLCNGVATASLSEPEPYRVVTAISPGGQAVDFHPNDLKALLAISYFRTVKPEALGGQCEVTTLDTGRVCSMNAAGFVIAVLNRLGVAQRSFLVDVFASRQIQFYAVAAAKVVLGAEHPPGSAPLAPALKDKVARLYDFEADLELSSTTLPSSEADVREPGAGEYQKVGVRAVPFHWSGQLAVDAAGELLGGRWTGEPADGPDCLGFPQGGPKLTPVGTLDVNPLLRLDVMLALAHASAGDGGTVDIGALEREALRQPTSSDAGSSVTEPADAGAAEPAGRGDALDGGAAAADAG